MTAFLETPSRPASRARLDVARMRIDDLTSSEVDAWSRLQRGLSEFHSPYFRPEFARLVGEARGDVEVAILSADGAPIGFFPFQVGKDRLAEPVGRPVSDYHGVIADPSVRWTSDELLRACNLKAYAFDHLLAGQSGFASGFFAQAESPVVDLPDGYEGYKSAKNAESDVLRFGERMKRRLSQRGEVAFDWNADETLLEVVHRWKRPRYVETSAFDPLETSWTADLIRRCLAERGDDFSGGIAALTAGGVPVAANVYLRSVDVVHSWIPAFDAELGKDSPGSVLFHESLRTADEIGMRRLDFGKGDERYKVRLMTGAVPLAEGGVDGRVAGRLVRRGWYGLRDFAKSSSWGRTLIERYRRIKRSVSR